MSKDIVTVESQIIEGEVLPVKIPEWGDGVWDDEPDLISWVDGYTKYPMCLKRNVMMGNWCGYVGIPKKHFYYGNDYGDHWEIVCHGGLSYSSGYHPITHKDDKYWWFGFDAAHAGDTIPYLNHTLNMNLPESLSRGGLFGETVYRDEMFMTDECQNIGIQLFLVQSLQKQIKVEILNVLMCVFAVIIFLNSLDFNEPIWCVFDILAITAFLSLGVGFFFNIQRLKKNLWRSDGYE